MGAGRDARQPEPPLWRKVQAALSMAAILLWVPVLGTVLVTTGTEKWQRLLGAAMLLLVPVKTAFEIRSLEGTQGPYFLWPSGKYRSKLGMIYDVFLNGDHKIVDIVLELSHASNFETWAIAMPHLTCVAVHTPQHIRHVFDTKFQNYIKGAYFHDVFEEALGDGIFNSDGATWKTQRGVASHLFTARQLNDRMAAVFQRRSRQLCDVLSAAVGKPRPTDIQELLFCFTFDSIYEVAFGRGVDSLGGDPKDRGFQHAFDEVQAGTARRFITPWWKLQRFFRYGRERSMKRSLRVIREYVEEVLHERRCRGDDNSPDPTPRNDGGDMAGDDLISLFCKLRREEGRGWTDNEVVDLVTNFTIAGRDTTASILTWCFYELSRHPNIRERLEDEIRRVADVSDMHLMQAVFQETLRLWPSVPIDVKFAKYRDVLPCGTVVRPGTGILFNPICFNHNPANFEEPQKWDPDRWMDAATGQCRKYDMQGFTYPAFNAGPRVCLGRHMAALEAKTVLAAVMSEYQIDVSPDFTPEKEYTVVLRSRNGMPIHAMRRQ